LGHREIDGFTLEIDDVEVVIRTGQYPNGRPSLYLEDTEGQMYAVISVNIPECPLGPGEFFVKDWSENQFIASRVWETGLFINTGKVARGDWVSAKAWRIKDG
jgi:hypothetical protein